MQLIMLCVYYSEREISERRQLHEAGLRVSEQLQERHHPGKPATRGDVLEEIVICDVSNKICYLSMVSDVSCLSWFNVVVDTDHNYHACPCVFQLVKAIFLEWLPNIFYSEIAWWCKQI